MKVFYQKSTQPQLWDLMNYEQFTQYTQQAFQLSKGTYSIKAKSNNQQIRTTKDLQLYGQQAGIIIEPHQQSLFSVLGVHLPENNNPQSHRIIKQKVPTFQKQLKTEHDGVESFKKILHIGNSNLSNDWKQIITRIKDLQAESYYFKNHMQENYGTFQEEIEALIDEANQLQLQQQQVFQQNTDLLQKIELTKKEIMEQQQQYDALKNQFKQENIEYFIQSKQQQNRNQIKIFKYIDEFDAFLNENKFILAYGANLDIRKKLQYFKNKYLQLSK
ncbi:unnamed protein product [Paramecium sonneborni]|uniref:Uncharacterized protein n=1 Tax=Paramecium sonneborni TaxID=65129 RepID=A0A8S1K9S8_9CILI|nr:unnamed protein product [Paramecium sonneborni]